jgi:hypothetical protein
LEYTDEMTLTKAFEGRIEIWCHRASFFDILLFLGKVIIY